MPRSRGTTGGPVIVSVNMTTDTVEIAGMTVTDALARLDSARLEEIRGRIANETYLTEDKLNIVYDRLVAVLRRVREENERATA